MVGEGGLSDVLFGNVEHLLLLFQAWPRGGGCTHEGRGRLRNLLGNNSLNIRGEEKHRLLAYCFELFK